MRIHSLTLVASAMLAALRLATAPGIAADTNPTFGDMFEQGRFLIDARYRYEHVDQAGFAEDADAHTLRVRGGLQTGKVWDLQGLIEIDGILQLNDDFNDTVNGNAAYPIVADPDDLQINRLQVEYTGLPQTTVTVGRQRINFDNQRFVGGVAFRQNEQTFDAARVTNTGIDGVALTYAYVNQVNRVFGEESNQGSFEGDTHLFNAAYDVMGVGKLSGYAYLIDLEDAPQATIPSNKTFGLRFAGKQDIADGFAALYALEHATQSGYANNPADYDVDYWLVEAGVGAHGFKLLGGIESLEGDGVNRFQTPLATLHKFQGYADVFLVTPPSGIVDMYATLGYEARFDDAAPLTGITAAVTYHAFEAERGGASFGSETDVEVMGRFGPDWSAGVKYADYDGDGAFADRQKLWLSVEFTY